MTTCSYSAQCFVSIILFNVQNNPLREGLLLSPHSTAERTDVQSTEYVVCHLTGSTWQDLGQAAWLGHPHFICSPLIHTRRSWLNSHPPLSVINMQLIANPMVLLLLNHKNSSHASAIALTPQDKKNRCNGLSSQSQQSTDA